MGRPKDRWLLIGFGWTVEDRSSGLPHGPFEDRPSFLRICGKKTVKRPRGPREVGAPPGATVPAIPDGLRRTNLSRRP